MESRVILDADKINIPFIIRFRQPGDQFVPFGMTQLKRLKEFFIDEKVPKYERDLIPVFLTTGKSYLDCGIPFG